jgi:hypothetical protein
MPHTVKCPQCVEAAIPSCVYPGNSRTTMAATQSYYDERGAFHIHDPNSTITSYVCDRGHAWSELDWPQCRCGWTAGPQDKEPRAPPGDNWIAERRLEVPKVHERLVQPISAALSYDTVLDGTVTTDQPSQPFLDELKPLMEKHGVEHVSAGLVRVPRVPE